MAHPSDPVSTPPPRRLDSTAQSGEITIHAECLHPELIDRIRQQAKWRVPIILAVVGIAATAIFTVSAVLYSQGAAAGATAVRVEAIEMRAREDRDTSEDRDRRERERAAAQALRDTELVQALHALDSRMARIEERLPARR